MTGLGKTDANRVGGWCRRLHGVDGSRHWQEQRVVRALLFVQQAQHLQFEVHVVRVAGDGSFENGHHVIACGNRHKDLFNVVFRFFVALDAAFFSSLLGPSEPSLDVVCQRQVIGQHLGSHGRLCSFISFERALHRVEAGSVVLVQGGGRSLVFQTVDAFLEHLVGLLVFLFVVLVEVSRLASQNLAAVVGAALGAWEQLHALVVKEHQAVNQHGVAGIVRVNFFEFLPHERRAVGVNAFTGLFWTNGTSLSPLDVRFVVVLLLLVRFVDTQRFFAVEALFFSGSVFVILRKTGIAHQRSGKAEKEEVLQDLHGFLFSVVQWLLLVDAVNRTTSESTTSSWRWVSR